MSNYMKKGFVALKGGKSYEVRYFDQNPLLNSQKKVIAYEVDPDSFERLKGVTGRIVKLSDLEVIGFID